VCEGEVERVDATIDAQIVMSAISRTAERFGINHIVSVVIGEGSDRIRQLGHDRIKTFGAGRSQDKRHWRMIIDNLLAQGFVRQTTGEYPVLQLQPESREVLFNGRSVDVLKPRKPAGKRARERAAATAGPFNEELFERLRALRKELASAQGVPPYVVFNDRTLHEMARFFPATESEMLQITGVGEKRAAQFGSRFIDAIREFRDEHPDGEPLGAMAAQPERGASSFTPPIAPAYIEEARKEHRRAYEKWSDAEDENLRRAWSDMQSISKSEVAKIRSVADDFHRQAGAIRSRLKKLGLIVF
jgi:ATP-dependent DNA helicase RecQ